MQQRNSTDSSLEPPFDTRPETLTVSQLNRQARRLLESHFDFVWIEGEISNLAMPASGHWYFSLKDDQAQVRCAMFRNRNQRLRFRPENGQLVRLRARVSLYEGRGEFQLIAEHIEEAGAGALQRAFEALKLKLQQEGLFAADQKLPLPRFPDRIAIVSSRSGAALRDLITVFQRRFPRIELGLFPVSVQGAEAAPAMCQALETINAVGGFDAIILARGGGSAEDLWAFNDEALARRIAASEIPVVSAVGHETDFTIADFVADRRAATPSAAAEMLSPDQRELLASLRNLEINLARQLRRRLQTLEAILRGLRRQLRHPGERLREQAQRLDDLEQRLQRAMRLRIRHRNHDLAMTLSRLRHSSPASRLHQAGLGLNHLASRATVALKDKVTGSSNRLALASARLNSLSPLATLQRGYAIVSDAAGSVVTQSTSLSVGDVIRAQLAEGGVTSEVIALDSTGRAAPETKGEV